MKAPTCRVERGSVVATKAFKASSCTALKKFALPPTSKLVSPSMPRGSNSLCQAAARVVVQQKRCRDFLTAPPVVQQHQSVRPPRQARRRRAIARQRDQMPTILRAEKAAANHAPSESSDPQKARNFSRLFNESGYTSNSKSISAPCFIRFSGF